MKFQKYVAVFFIVTLSACSTPRSELSPVGVPVEASEVEKKQMEIELQSQVKNPLDSPLTFQRATRPHYTAYLRRHDIEGSVTVGFQIAPDGSVSNVSVIGQAHPALAANMIATVSSWRFMPIFADGKPVTLSLLYAFTYRLL